MGRTPKIVAVLLLVGSLLALSGCTRYGAPLARNEDPVVLTGSATPKLLGSAVARIVGFSWDGGAWHQIPVQVDERDVVNPGQILHRPPASWAKNADGTEFLVPVYTTPSVPAAGYRWWDTFVGSDRDPMLDADDEISFLAIDSGKAAPDDATTPPGVVADTRELVTITDPLDAEGASWVYLFRSESDAMTGGSAGTTGVMYNFSLDSGDYRTTYKMGTGALAPNKVAGFNPEHTTVSTGVYTLGYSDRWLNDTLKISTGGASGADVLERSRIQFAPGLCGRSEQTFNGGATNPYEGGFVANISGPVRALRSHIGTNSGQYTVATDSFYPHRTDLQIDLRVHSIPGVMQFDDFTTGLAGLKYSDDQNTGVPIDGVPDAIVAAHVPLWQMVSGAPGSIVTARVPETDIAGLELSTYALDQKPASPRPCTGDTTAWGQYGVQVVGAAGGPIACTDPTRADCPAGVVKRLTSKRFRYLGAPNLSTARAAELASHGLVPVTTTVTG